MMKIHLTHTLLPAAFLVASMAPVSADNPTGIQDTTPIAVNFGAGYNYKYDGWYNFAAGPNGRVVDGVDYAYDFTDVANKPGFTGNTGYPSAMNASPAYPNPIYSQLNSATGYALSTPGYSKTYDPDSPASSRAAFNKVANGNGSGGLDKFNADGTRNGTTWGGSGFGPVPSGGSLYGISFSNYYNARGGTVGVFEASPLDSLSTISLQIQIGSANGYDFYEPLVSGPTGGGSPANPEIVPWGTADSRPLGALTDFESWSPQLYITLLDGSTIQLGADAGEVLLIGNNGTIPMPTGPDGEMVDEDIIINLYGFTWDLSEFQGEIESFITTWDIAEHTQLYAVRLDQGALVPEPSTYALLLGSAACALIIYRRKNKRG